MSNQTVVERYLEAVAQRDTASAMSFLHPDVVSRFPQSGEVVRGKANYEAIMANYPTELPDAEVSGVIGEPGSVTVSTPIPFGMPNVSIVGAGDQFVAEGKTTYPDGTVYHMVGIFRVRDGLIAEETLYWADPFDPPEWRSEWVAIEPP